MAQAGHGSLASCDLYPPCQGKMRPSKVVKLFIVLTPQFLSHDQGRLTKELQQHVKSVTHPCEYLRKLCAQTLQREMAERKAVYKQHRWEKMEKQSHGDTQESGASPGTTGPRENFLESSL
ncbi:nuclear pore complex-interacting protein family member B4 [Macaca nemestrina]|uniref:nuclear pore complex-interacting protein family member B4 n=1 Tax=Macaca nemestrina TaxID=9545 RepID=UPI0039B91FEE